VDFTTGWGLTEPTLTGGWALAVHIQDIYETSRRSYGYLNIHAELCGAEGVGKHWVAHLMGRMCLKMESQ
jgi:hypothetical protein